MGGSLQNQPGPVAEQVVWAGCVSALMAGVWWGRDGCELVARLQLLSFEQSELQLVLLSLVAEAEAVVVVVVEAVVEAGAEVEFEVLAEAVWELE